MGNILELVKNILSVDIDMLIDRGLLDNEKVLLKNYQNVQLQYGKDENGRLIGVYASQAYSTEKQQMNPLANGNVDLKYSGNMYAGMKIIQDGEVYTIESNVDYFDTNIDRYGPEWLGWSEETLKENVPIILKTMQKELRDALQL